MDIIAHDIFWNDICNGQIHLVDSPVHDSHDTSLCIQLHLQVKTLQSLPQGSSYSFSPLIRYFRRWPCHLQSKDKPKKLCNLCFYQVKKNNSLYNRLDNYGPMPGYSLFLSLITKSHHLRRPIHPFVSKAETLITKSKHSLNRNQTRMALIPQIQVEILQKIIQLRSSWVNHRLYCFNSYLCSLLEWLFWGISCLRFRNSSDFVISCISVAVFSSCIYFWRCFGKFENFKTKFRKMSKKDKSQSKCFKEYSTLWKQILKKECSWQFISLFTLPSMRLSSLPHTGSVLSIQNSSSWASHTVMELRLGQHTWFCSW